MKKALGAAGGRFADEQMTVLRGVLNILGDLLEIRAPAARMRSDRVRIDGGRTSSIAYRPEFWPWSIDVPIVFNARGGIGPFARVDFGSAGSTSVWDASSLLPNLDFLGHRSNST